MAGMFTPLSFRISRCFSRGTLWVHLLGGYFFVIVPIDLCLLNAVENGIAAHLAEIIPSPCDDRLNLRSGVCQQHYVNAKPCNESDHAPEISAANAHFRHRRVSADHRHDFLVNITKWLSGPAGSFECNI